MRYIFIGIIRLYQLILSPLLPPNTCRFYPTCSQYAIDAYRMFGVFKGTWKAAGRILRCHPFHPGGYDPVVNDDESIDSEPRKTAMTHLSDAEV